MSKSIALDDGTYLYDTPAELYRRGYDEFDPEVDALIRVPAGLVADGRLHSALLQMVKPEFRDCIVDSNETGMAYAALRDRPTGEPLPVQSVGLEAPLGVHTTIPGHQPSPVRRLDHESKWSS